MISDVKAFLDWFEGVHRRTVRDVSILPEDAETWEPGRSESGEEAWGVPMLVQHIAEARLYFAGAFLGRGWVWDAWREMLGGKDGWTPALEESLERFRDQVRRAGPERLSAKIELIDAPGRRISGWRALMMMAEHEIAHRAQIGAYAGLNGWPVAQIFDRDNEWVVAQREKQIARYRSTE